ncbi:MarR family transcriptional regulator [Sphingomonas sp.]|uniref:MarR family transcriptional regulator n=1 Tax=Sphingomonas sp. TaxID=28214 RepID=UPI0025F15295|nr:MarR family transcriptional regulator [Sphingomonas sp.]
MSRHRSIFLVDALPGDALIDGEVIDVVRGVLDKEKASPIDRARAIYRGRRARNRHFDDSLFAEPSWDILLDLFIADGVGRSVTVSSACIGAAAPHATALRHLGMMQRKGLLERSAHPNDARCQQVRISATAAASMRGLLANLP